MKKTFKLALLMAVAALTVVSCGKSDLKGFKKTADGLHYKFIEKHKDAQQVKEGDLLIVNMTLRLNDSVIYSNKGEEPQRWAQVKEGMFKGDLTEGLLMMHLGDKAIFAVEADSLAQFFQMPPFYTPGNGDKMYWEIDLAGIISEDELAQEQANYMANMEKAKVEEPELIAKYVADNNITAKPNKDGLYVIVKKKGTGAKVAAGKNVRINYTGRLLDGKVFDTSIEGIAQEAGIYDARRPYQPLSYIVGQTSLIDGWTAGVMGQPEGSSITLIVPSGLAYGPHGNGPIEPYTPLVFDLDIVSVE